MGGSLEGNKKHRNFAEDELRNKAQMSGPVMPVSGRACSVEDGKVVLNFRHYKEDYDNIQKNLIKLKNQLNIITSSDALEIIQKKLEDLKALVVNGSENGKQLNEAINGFIPLYTENLKKYYLTLADMKKTYKQSSLEMQQLLTNWLKDQKKVEVNHQINLADNYYREMNETKNNFNKFNEVIDMLNKICNFDIKYNNNNDKINEINNFFNTNNEEIKKIYNFENPPQFRSLINFKEQINNNIKQKNDFFEDLLQIFSQNINIYKKVLGQINSSNLEKVEIVAELNDYTNVVIYHRLIRSIEEKLKLIKIN